MLALAAGHPLAVETQNPFLRSRRPDFTLDLGSDYAAGDVLLARHRPYRASVTRSRGVTDITVGRQRIAWGNGRFRSPLDVLNHFDDTRIEREERDGIDALLVSRPLGALAHVSAVAAPSTPRAPPVVAGYVHWNAGWADYSLAAGRVRDEYVIGADLAGRLGGVGIRAEATALRPAGGQNRRAGPWSVRATSSRTRGRSAARCT